MFAAVIPGFILTNTSATLLSFLLSYLMPDDKLSAVATATIASYLIYLLVILWIFSVERLRMVWLGLLISILITAEIDHWMKPERTPARSVSLDQSLEAALQRLKHEAEGADRWIITPAGGRDVPHLSFFWQGPPPEEEGEERQRGSEELDALTGEPLPEDIRATGGGQVLYRIYWR